MTPGVARFGLLTFALLTGALATNMFVLQPPVRLARGFDAPASSQVPGPDAAGAGAVVEPLETGTLKPPGQTSDRSDLTRAIQRELKAKGYEAGAVDGVAGLVTRGAIMAFASDTALPLTAEPREGLLQALLLGSAQARAPGAAADTAPGPEAVRVIEAVQRALNHLGYLRSAPDGRLNDETRRAIRRFEADRKLAETGRISGELIAKLAAVAGEALRTAQQ
jgi:peptidoglycan hydrolase-like protein with peptidoglycan-binding domain